MAKITVEHEGDRDTDHSWGSWESFRESGKETR